MTPEDREQEIERICQAALDRNASDRVAFLTEACGSDEALLREVQGLLAHEETAARVLARPALELAAEGMATAAHDFRAGQQIGVYTIVSELGSGGMGDVYRARDPRLKRDVALKVLPEPMAADAERRQRFEREAQAVAALNHPNIVTIHSVEQADGVHFLTMELVEGKTLADAIGRRGLGVDQILKFAIPLADAVSAAHARGITHRDLKPTNIMVSRDGRVKVLDFGLAKLTDDARGADLTASPTKPLTSEGHILGTVAYMSPEQAEGKSIDHRSDIFSLGIILYELATGERPFRGDSNLSVLSSIMKDTPGSVTEINQALPRELGRIIRHCLAKDPDRRYQSATDLRNELEELKQDLDSGELARAVPPPRPKYRQSSLIGGTVVVVVVVAAVGRYVLYAPEHISDAPVTRVEATKLTTEAGLEEFPSLSPDGKWVVYHAGGDIHLRAVGGQTLSNLTKDSPDIDTQPAFSRDGERIAFRSDRLGGGIWMMGRTGESPRLLAHGGFTPAWSPDGSEIVYATQDVNFNPEGAAADRGELWIVKIATEEKRRIGSGMQPNWSPAGHRIAAWAMTGGKADIYTIPASGGEIVPVTNDAAFDWNPVWSPDGKYLYFSSNRGGSFNLWRSPIDEASGKPRGRLEPVTTPSPYVAHLTFSADGRHVAYTSIAETANIQRAPFDVASGTLAGEPIPVTTGSQSWAVQDPSPDNKMLAFISLRMQGEEEDLFVSGTDGSGVSRLTNDPANDRNPRWSPDGTVIAFQSTRSGSNQIWTIRPDGSDRRQLTEYEGNLSWPAWSSDGTRMSANDGPRNKVLIFDPRAPWKAQTPSELPQPAGKRFSATAWSPDGEWLAGFEGGPLGVAVYSLKTHAYRRLANYGGAAVVWLKDSRRVLFNADGQIFLVDIQSGKSQKVFSLPGERVNQPSLSRDNGWIYFRRVKTEGDIWLATLK